MDSSDTDTDNAVVFAAPHGTMKNVDMGKWLIHVDLGASSHLTNQKEILKQYKEFQQKVGLGDGRTVLALGAGNVQVNMRCGLDGKIQRSIIHDALFVPMLTCN